MSDQGAVLKEACDEAMSDPSLAPKIDKKTGKVLVTHCNQGVLRIARAMGCVEFDTSDPSEPFTADEMITLMASNASGKWEAVSGSDAVIHALDGGLAIAAKSSQELGEAHGHVAVVYPVGRQRSDSWKKDVPMLANVGKENLEEKASQVFPVLKGEPAYYVWR